MPTARAHRRASSMSLSKPAVIPPFLRQICGLLNTKMNTKRVRHYLADTLGIHPEEEVTYVTVAIVNVDRETYWRIYTDCLGDRLTDRVYLYQERPGPDTSYILASRIPADNDKGYVMIKTRYTDLQDLIVAVLAELVPDGISFTWPSMPNSFTQDAFESPDFWDATAQQSTPIAKRLSLADRQDAARTVGHYEDDTYKETIVYPLD